MRSRPLVRTLLLLSLTLVATCRGEAGRASADAARPAMPVVELAALDGRRLSSADFAGRVVLYDFWATWCTPCHVQVEVLAEMHERARAAGVEFVAVATGEPEAIVREFLTRSPYPYTVLLDPDERLGTALEVLGLPTLVVADREGRIVWRRTGLTPAEAIAQALAEAGAPLAD